MPISIVSRLKPYSHLSGTICPLPGSFFSVRIYPTRLEFFNLSAHPAKLIDTLDLKIQGPVQDFTIELDLERGWIKVWGKSKKDYFRYRISAHLEKKTFAVIPEKKCEISYYCPDQIPQENYIEFVPDVSERLSLGIHKAQEWDKVTRRLNMAEIFPFWLRLGSQMPNLASHSESIASLLESSGLDGWYELFLAGFEGILSPRFYDTDYQGIKNFSTLNQWKSSPLLLLTDCARLIREKFVKVQGTSLNLLNQLPREFISGRMVQVTCDNFAILDMEWRKKMIRRMRIKALKSIDIQMNFPQKLRTYRIKTSKNDQGIVSSPNNPLVLKEGETYLLDRFEK